METHARSSQFATIPPARGHYDLTHTLLPLKSTRTYIYSYMDIHMRPTKFPCKTNSHLSYNLLRCWCLRVAIQRKRSNLWFTLRGQRYYYCLDWPATKLPHACVRLCKPTLGTRPGAKSSRWLYTIPEQPDGLFLRPSHMSTPTGTRWPCTTLSRADGPFSRLRLTYLPPRDNSFFYTISAPRGGPLQRQRCWFWCGKRTSPSRSSLCPRRRNNRYRRPTGSRPRDTSGAPLDAPLSQPKHTCFCPKGSCCPGTNAVC